MPKATILFVCSDNTLLSPLAESYVNQRIGGLIRAFSAGLNPGVQPHPGLGRVLASAGMTGQDLQPKSLDVFLLPHAPIPDRIVCFSGTVPRHVPGHLRFAVDWHDWNISVDPGAGLDELEAVFQKIRHAVDRLLGRSVPAGMSGLKVA